MTKRNTRLDGTALSAEHIGQTAAENLDLATPSLTPGDEGASHEIPVGIQLKSLDGKNLKKAVQLECRMFDADLEPAVEAAFTCAETGDGTEDSTTAKAGLLVTTDANGAAEVTITDATGTLTGDGWLRVQPVGHPGETVWQKLTWA